MNQYLQKWCLYLNYILIFKTPKKRIFCLEFYNSRKYLEENRIYPVSVTFQFSIHCIMVWGSGLQLICTHTNAKIKHTDRRPKQNKIKQGKEQRKKMQTLISPNKNKEQNISRTGDKGKKKEKPREETAEWGRIFAPSSVSPSCFFFASSWFYIQFFFFVIYFVYFIDGSIISKCACDDAVAFVFYAFLIRRLKCRKGGGRRKGRSERIKEEEA